MKKLRVINIKKIYGKHENKLIALDGIDLIIEPNKFTAIVGDSGSGKTTLLHCIAGLDKPTSGKVFLDNVDIYSLNDSKLSEIRRKNFGFVFQSFNLIPVINIYNNIILPISLSNEKVDTKYIKSIIEKLSLKSQVNKFPNELSGGQQQRVAIARALASKPSVIFADEPTGNLDTKTTKDVMDLLRLCVNDFKQTLVLITHNNDVSKLSDRIITISDGKVIRESK